MKKVLFLLTTLAIISCKKETGEIIVRDFQQMHEQVLGTSEAEKVPLPPGGVPYYAANNFIIDSDGNIFYYNFTKPEISSCLGSPDYEIRPEYIHLEPGQLTAVKEDEFISFLDKKTGKDNRTEFFTIASEKDTLESDIIVILAKKYESYDRWPTIFRKTTQEEMQVLLHHKDGKKYIPENISWDSTRIILPAHLKK